MLFDFMLYDQNFTQFRSEMKLKCHIVSTLGQYRCIQISFSNIEDEDKFTTISHNNIEEQNKKNLS